MIAIAALFVAIFLMVSASGVVPGKGGDTYLAGATISGRDIAEPLTFKPDVRYDGVFALHAPANGIQLIAAELATLEATVLPYEVTLHYDFGRYTNRLPPANATEAGSDTRDWTARYDGNSLLYFDRALGGQGPGWYQATPELANALRFETAWAIAAPGQPALQLETSATLYRRVGIMLSLTIAVIAGLYLRGTKLANLSPLQMQSRMANRALQLGPGAWR